MSLYRFAGLTVEMQPEYPTLCRQAEPYRISEAVPPDISLDIQEFLERLRQYPDENISPESAEYVYATSLFYRRLLAFDGIMLHASAVAYNERAYLFSAPPGTGKSTHTAGWVRTLGKAAVILNDDKPALRRIDGAIYACGTPFSGSSPLSCNRIVPVGGICLLSQGKENHIQPISATDALPFLYEQTLQRLNRKDGERMLELLWRIAQETPLYKMECTVGIDAVQCAFEAMTGQPLPISQL